MEKEKIMNAFQAWGLTLNALTENLYAFKFEDISFLWIVNEDNPSFLNLAIPNILSMSDIDELFYHKLMDRINATSLYVKANTYDDGMWLFYERELVDENENIEKILQHMITYLEGAYQNFYNALRACEEVLKASMTGEGTESDDDDESE